MHKFLLWEVVVGELSVCGGSQDCLEVVMGVSIHLSKEHGRADAQLSVQVMWKQSTWQSGREVHLCPWHVVGGVCPSVCQDQTASLS